MLAARGSARKLLLPGATRDASIMAPMDRWLTLLARFLVLLLGSLPERAALAFAAALGHLGYHLMRSRRRIALANLELAYGKEKTPAERRRIARASFRNAARVAVDLARLPKLTPEVARAKIRVVNEEGLSGPPKQGRGVLALSAHLGSFEILAAGSGRLGLNRGTNLIGRPPHNSGAGQVLISLRESAGVHTIASEGAVADVVRRVKENAETIGIVLDQNWRHGVFVDFFGVPARTAPGLAVMHKKANDCAALVPVFTARDADDPTRHAIYVDRELPYERADSEADEVWVNTQRYTTVIEQYVRRFPEQWFWAHDRWKSRPNTVEMLELERRRARYGAQLEGKAAASTPAASAAPSGRSS